MRPLRGREGCWIQARSFAQQNSILNTACGVETTCRGGGATAGGHAGAAYHEHAAVSPYGGTEDAVYPSAEFCAAKLHSQTAQR
ncbi:MAG: hypothetical protein LBL31_00170, partial [Spirochaetaceae bacterium]|nr:hypothetical protein [Spirochaetaceae bacterium]